MISWLLHSGPCRDGAGVNRERWDRGAVTCLQRDVDGTAVIEDRYSVGYVEQVDLNKVL